MPSILRRGLSKEFSALNPVLDDAVRLNRSLLKQPFQTEDLDVTLNYNIWEFYRRRGARRADSARRKVRHLPH